MQQPPTYVPVIIQQPPPRQGRGPFATCCLVTLLGLVLMVCCVGAGVGGGYLLLRNGTINERQIFSLMGKGSGEVHVTNLGDSLLNVSINGLDSEESTQLLVNSLHLMPLDKDGFTASPGHYRLDFSDGNGAATGNCTLSINGDSQFYFVAMPRGIAVASSSQKTVSKAADLDIATSPLCQP